MNPKLVVLSFDSLQSGDLETLLGMPNFRKLSGRLAVVKANREVYPTLTYPVHSTVLTGVHPDRHGLFHNQKPSFSPAKPDWSLLGAEWYFQKTDVRVPTLLDAALAKGLSVASILWPSTAGDFRYHNIPQIWPTRDGERDLLELYLSVTPGAMVDGYLRDFLRPDPLADPREVMDHGAKIGPEVLAGLDPDVFFGYAFHLDHLRHVEGVRSRLVPECLKFLDMIFGAFVDAADRLRGRDRTNFVVFGDHGQIDVENALYLNTIFRDKGLIRTGPDNRVLDYEAYSFSSGFSTQINPKNPGDRDSREKVGRILSGIQREYPRLVERIYTKEEAEKEERLAGDFWFVLEGTEGTVFMNEFSEPPVVPRSSPDFRALLGNHGHHPDKGEKPPLIAFGPGVREGAVVERGRIIDICPTLAALAGLDFPQAEGDVLPILRDLPEFRS